MSHHHPHHPNLSRRDFLKLSGAALGGAALACGGGQKLLELTAVPTSNLPAAQVPTLAAVEFADGILVNGNILTMNAQRSTVKALAIKNGLILSVGDEPAIRALAGDSTQVINLQGRTVTPGLIDAHCHLSACGLSARSMWISAGPSSRPSKKCRHWSRSGSPKPHPANGCSVRAG